MNPTVQQWLHDSKDKMGKAVAFLQEEFKGIRTGRATTALVDRIRVEYYGTPTPIQQLAQITIPEPRMIVLKPFDLGALKEIERAVLKSELGVTPVVDGKIVRISLPPLSGEQRKKLAGRVKEMAEAAKVSLRNVRRDALKHLEQIDRDGKSSADEIDRAKKEVETLLKAEEKQVDESLEKKNKEILEE
jgi:ribosome recycling factor